MDTLPLLRPELLPLVERTGSTDVSAETLTSFRAFLDQKAGQAFLQAEDYPVKLEQLHIPGPDGAPDIRLFTLRPDKSSSESRPVLLHFHGGGQVAGRPELATTQLCKFVQALDCVVISPDYRLAPETPFPGGLEDAYTTLCWIHDNADSLGIDPAKIGVTGESAGGNIATAVCLLARDRKGPAILFQNLLYPMLDDRTIIGESDPSPVAGQFIWTRASNTYSWQAFLNPVLPASADVSVYASPARATDLSGLPPAFLSVGTLDLFLDENLTYARALIRSGIPVELEVIPGACHVFDEMETSFGRKSLERRIASMAYYFG
ncbi:alpha/beta hydrolase [Gluconobacter morbifer]|nr:alpha/beta hydrolase [Gluconobacter morbifer]